MPSKTKRKTKPVTAVDPVTDIHQRLHALGYITSDRALMVECYALTMRAKMTTKDVPALLLQGPPGTGKTFLAETMARYVQAEDPIIFQFTPGVTKEELMYDLNIPNIVRAQSNKWLGEFLAEHTVLPGIFVEALVRSQKERTILLLDELDKASEKVDAFLLDYLQSCRMRAGPMGMLHGNPRNLMVFITMNNQRQLSEPLMRRCLRHELGWPLPEVEQEMILALASRRLTQLGRQPYPDLNIQMASHAKVMVSLANEVRQYAQQLKKVPSSPELADALVDLAVIPNTPDWGEKAYKTLLAYPEDRKLAKSVWRKQPGDITRQLVDAVTTARRKREEARALRKQGESSSTATKTSSTSADSVIPNKPSRYYHNVTGTESLQWLVTQVNSGVILRKMPTPIAASILTWMQERGVMYEEQWTDEGYEGYRTDMVSDYPAALETARPLRTMPPLTVTLSVGGTTPGTTSW